MMQCKDIPDAVLLQAISNTPGYWRTWEQVEPHLAELLPNVPFNVLVAKMRKLDKQGKVHACVHHGHVQCRGDIHLPEECKGC